MKKRQYLTDTPPSALIGDTAKARWQHTIQNLAAENRKIPKSNEGVLIGYCSAFELLAECEESIRTDGLLVDGGRDGKRRSPALSGKIQALAAIKQFANELALSPSSAKRVPLPPIEKEYNPFSKFSR